MSLTNKANKLLYLPNHPHKLKLTEVIDIKNEVPNEWTQGCGKLCASEV